MTLVQFTIKGMPIYINPKTIVSISPREEGTEITTVNYNEFYVVDQHIETIIKSFKTNSLTKQIIKITNGKEG
jgi:uncharacterized protein YlzI (FlbEa/FlbD family)